MLALGWTCSFVGVTLLGSLLLGSLSLEMESGTSRMLRVASVGGTGSG